MVIWVRFCDRRREMYYFIRRYLSAFQLWRYVLTLPFYYMNSMIPAVGLYLGAWIVEHGLHFYQLIGVMLLMVLLFFGLGKTAIYHQGVLYTSVHQAGKKLRMDLLEVMIRNRKIGIDNSVQLNDVEKIEENLFLGGVELIEQILFYFLAFGIVFFLNSKIACFLLVLSLIVCGISMKSRKKGAYYQSQNSIQQKKQLEFLEQTELGYETILMYQQQKRMEQQFHHCVDQLCRVQGNLSWNQDKNQIITMVFLLASGSLSLLMGGYFIKMGELTMPQLLVIIQCNNYLFKPIQRIMPAWFQVQSVQKTVEKLNTILKAESEMDSCRAEELTGADKEKEEFRFNREMQVQLQDFSIGKKKILQSIAFRIQKGEKVLLLGENGCGKTTLLRYLLGQYGYQEGSFWIDGVDCSHLPWDKVSQIFAPVDQNFFLLSGTVKENISCFRDLPKDIVEEVISLCHMEEFADRDEVSNLSGGQMQRTAIARAAAARRKVMILDEAFRAVDAENAVSIEQLLLQIKELTMIEIAHRISIESYQLFDKIILLSQGRIEQIGTPKQLLGHPFIQNLTY